MLDIPKTDDRERLFQHEIDMLANNAGHMKTGFVAEMPMDCVRENFAVSVFGTLAMIKGIVRQVAARKSRDCHLYSLHVADT